VDRAVGAAGVLVRAAYGSSEYEALQESVATEAVEHTLTPLQDPELSRRGAGAMREMFTERMREISPSEFVETLRAATREDEWLLVAHGALFGTVGGLLHYVVFGL
jgi:broad specificity phosphatase PhoE